MKTQVLVTIHYMELGGAEMSLLGLLESLDYSKYEVDLFVYSHRGELLRHIDQIISAFRHTDSIIHHHADSPAQAAGEAPRQMAAHPLYREKASQGRKCHLLRRRPQRGSAAPAHLSGERI